MTPNKQDEILQHCREQEMDSYGYDDYSGRGMFGSTTQGVVVDKLTDAHYLAKLFSLRLDNLGLHYIVY